MLNNPQLLHTAVGAANPILVVDDDRVVRTAIEAHLARNDFSIVAADSCAAAMELAQLKRPSLLVLDLRLPDGLGWDLLRDIRSAYPESNFPAILISSSDVTRSQLRRHHVDRFMRKPLDFQFLLATVLEIFPRDIGLSGSDPN